MSAFELFVAIGGVLLVIFFLIQAMQREREPDGYRHRDGLIEMARPRGKGKPAVPLRPAAARILAAKEKEAAAKRRELLPPASGDDSTPSAS
jgi:hypothetical protein